MLPKSVNQRRYLDAIERNDIVFGIGPAGTGKTYLAMAQAVSFLLAKKVNRIILARPAVEAGEKLGFLPGDLQEKVNPYLRPLYDALYDMLDVERAERLIERGTVEVAPIAFMRGRTLNDAFVILDEAQNTTQEQMKMFLTRLGFGSKAVITGDITQIDLPTGRTSGLVEAMKVVGNIEGIEFIWFDDKDVVRHQLVQQIVKVYESVRWIPTVSACPCAVRRPGERGRAQRRPHVTVTDGRGRPVRDGGLARWLAALVPPVSRRRRRRPCHRLRTSTSSIGSTAERHSRQTSCPSRTRQCSPTAEHPSEPAAGSRTANREPRLLGDIVIATGVAQRQAREAGHSYGTELRVLALHGLLHLLGYDHDDPEDRGRMARAEARLRRRGGLREGLISRAGTAPALGTRAAAPDAMIPVLLLLLAVAAVYVGTIETAFSTLMRLSLRLMAERGGRDDRLGLLLRRPDPAVRACPADARHHLLAGDDVDRHPDRTHRVAAVDRDADGVRRGLHPDLRARAPDVHRAPDPERVLERAAAAVRRRGPVRPAADQRAGAA